jgi:hypothetical protein
MIFDGLKKTRNQVDGQMAWRDDGAMEVGSKKGQLTDGTFPKKGRQLFVAAKMAPPLAISWVRHCCEL